MRARFAFFLAAALSCLGALPAWAHPHVWVNMRSTLLFDASGNLTGVKQDWTFDEAFTAFALQGFPKDASGNYAKEVLAPLAEVNVTSLKEFDYFVRGKTPKAKIAFKDPTDYSLTFANDTLTLHFVLPVEKPVPAKGTLSFDVYDPTYFVSFEFAEKDPVAMQSAPAGCAFTVTSPDQPQSMQIDESFFTNLTSSSTYGAQYADKIQLKCPQ
ncbi:ABC transporter substrate-binding protein [Azorhizobium oxalatiphilum]|uniref:ABC transporter substrate-binding protein n=1 Tax=Azorhizobium oxalatiphilum TaxID=980631 RepID=A0A917CD40_9HYPH|nr:DUF1007 family protein [Azorhizobium oxalatiphilum]GGF81819.1 ABC transporter substrate-binding protein [Azorhizobium oxalatiphilum]